MERTSGQLYSDGVPYHLLVLCCYFANLQHKFVAYRLDLGVHHTVLAFIFHFHHAAGVVSYGLVVAFNYIAFSPCRPQVVLSAFITFWVRLLGLRCL